MKKIYTILSLCSCILYSQEKIIGPGGVPGAVLWMQPVAQTEDWYGAYKWQDYSGDSLQVRYYDPRGATYGLEYLGMADNYLRNYNFNPALSFNYSYSESKGLSTLVDINGDELPDKVFVEKSGMYYRPGQIGGTFGNKIKIKGADQFSSTYSNATSGGIKTYIGKATAGADKEITRTKISRYLIDVNGDGLVDLVVGNKVYFNHIERDSRGNLIPTFTLSSGDTPSPINGGGVIDDSDTAVDPQEQAEIIANNPLQDVVKVWIAPYDGEVNIKGEVKLLEPQGEYDTEAYKKADGVRVAVQYKNKELKAVSIIANDFTVKDMSVKNLEVKAGERIYFRVQSGTQENSNGDFDEVEWSPVVSYIQLTGTDSNGYTPVYSSQAETVLADQGVVMLPIVDQYTIKGNFEKPITTDPITLKVLLGENTIVYEKIFDPQEIYTGELIIPVLNSQKADQLQFIVQSPTYMNWEKIKWTPIIYYSTPIEIENEVIQSYEQFSIGTVFYENTYETLVAPGEGQVIANKGKGTLNTLVELKPNLSLEEKSEINAEFLLKVKNSSGTFYNGKLVIDNGIIIEGAKQDVSLPAEKVWVELYAITQSTEGLKNIASVTTQITDTMSIQTQSSTAVYRKWNLTEFGPLHRQWGQFSYNAMEGRATKPIDESLLKLLHNEEDTNLYPLNPLKMIFIPMHINTETKTYWEGNDIQVFIKQNRMSASRLGIKDVILENPLSGLGNTGDKAGIEKCK